MHVWNLMQIDLELNMWNRREHRWLNMEAVKYNGNWVRLDAHDTKGGQQSPFDDGLQGAYWIVIRRPLTAEAESWLHERFHHLEPDRWNRLHGVLTRIYTGEMEPYFIMRYGFYEGHTAWRADPVGIAHVFGIRSLKQVEKVFSADLCVPATHTQLRKPTNAASWFEGTQ